jgi:hypothetical protein
MAIVTATLHTEITTDPKGLGYAGQSDYAISVIMNTPGASGEFIFRGFTSIWEIVAAIVRSEYDALAAADKAYLNAVILAPGVQLKSGNSTLRSQIGAIFGSGTTTRTNLTAAAQKSATRGEVLFGEGTTIADTDVAAAR